MHATCPHIPHAGAHVCRECCRQAVHTPCRARKPVVCFAVYVYVYVHVCVYARGPPPFLSAPHLSTPHLSLSLHLSICLALLSCADMALAYDMAY